MAQSHLIVGVLSATYTVNVKMTRGSHPYGHFFKVLEEDNTTVICNTYNAFAGFRVFHSKSCHHHKSILREYEAAAASFSTLKKRSAPPPSWVPNQKAFENCSKFSEDNPKAKAIAEKITEIIALNKHPFPMVWLIDPRVGAKLCPLPSCYYVTWLLLKQVWVASQCSIYIFAGNLIENQLSAVQLSIPFTFEPILIPVTGIQ